MEKKIKLTKLSTDEVDDRFSAIHHAQSQKHMWNWFHANQAVIEAMRGIGVDITNAEIKLILSLTISQVLESIVNDIGSAKAAR